MRFLISKFFELFTLIPKNLKLKLLNKLFRVLNDKDSNFYYIYNEFTQILKLCKYEHRLFLYKYELNLFRMFISH